MLALPCGLPQHVQVLCSYAVAFWCNPSAGFMCVNAEHAQQQCCSWCLRCLQLQNIMQAK